MFSLYLQVAILLICCIVIHCLEDCIDHPLILTPYIEEGKIEEAQEKAQIIPDIQGVKSYSGFFTVNKKCGNNLFFWFIPAQNNWKTAPVLLWLNGDMVSSSLIGLFAEIGPFNHLKDEGFVKNRYPWTDNNSIVFLDQPVGAGYSFTEKGCYAKNMTDAAQDIYSAVVQFFTLFPNLQKNKFFLTGESIAGQYLPSTASEIDRRNKVAQTKINLVGILIGNPFIDVSCLHKAPFLYELGVVDEKEANAIKDQINLINKYIDAEKYDKAFAADLETYSKAFAAVALPNTFNILLNHYYTYEYEAYIRNYKVRKQINVGNVTYNHDNGGIVFTSLSPDNYRPSTPIIQELLKSGKYIVGFYSGQLDLSCLYTSLSCVLHQLKWEGSAMYLKANRTPWYVDGRLAGWYKVAGNLFEVVFRNAGHHVPRDQGRAALEFISAAISDSPGTKLLSKLKTNA